MFCSNCGAQITANFCANCGTAKKSESQTTNQPLQFNQTRAVYATVPGAQTSTMAIVALVMSFLFPLLGVILGFVARNEIKNSQGTKTGDAQANLAIILGFIFMFLYFVFFFAYFATFGSYGY